MRTASPIIYPDVAIGRDNGLAYWGDFGMLKMQVGAFDGETLGGSAVADKSKLRLRRPPDL